MRVPVPRNAKDHLGPLPPPAPTAIPAWAEGVCPTLEHAPPMPLPEGVEWPLPPYWWRSNSPCPDDAEVNGDTPPRRSDIRCERYGAPHGPETDRNANGHIYREWIVIDVPLDDGRRALELLRSREIPNDCGQEIKVQLTDGTTLFSAFDGFGTPRLEMVRRVVNRGAIPYGCVRSWDVDGELLQISYWTEEGVQEVRRRPGAPVPRAATDDYAMGMLERRRIERHLRSVEDELRLADTSTMSPAMQRARIRNLDRLHEYWMRGEFPRNEDGPTASTPVFIDEHDTACAVGHLMRESGHDSLAATIARDEKYDRLADIETPGVADWIANSGLTADEHARIQPSYCKPNCPPEDDYVCLDNGDSMPACYFRDCYYSSANPSPTIAHEGPCWDWALAGQTDCGPSPE